MTRKWMKSWFQAAVAVLLIAAATLARGDVPGPLEVAVSTGYTRGVGSVSGRMPELQHLAGGATRSVARDRGVTGRFDVRGGASDRK